MKSLSNLKKGTRMVAGVIAVGAGAAVLTAPLLRADDSKGQGLVEKIQDWQNVMSDKFRDTWKSLRKVGTPSVVSASIALRFKEPTDERVSFAPGCILLNKTLWNTIPENIRAIRPDLDTCTYRRKSQEPSGN